jgi:peptide/nickel transport system permease protein
MRSYIAKRLVLLVFVVFGVVSLTFVLVRAAPGDPARNVLGDKASNAAVAALRHQWGLDQPLGRQYVTFLRQVVTGNLGHSFYFHVSIQSLIESRLPTTLLLMAMATLFAVVIALPLSTWVALKGRGGSDLFVRILNALFLGSPSFLIGTLLIIVFGLKLRWFPVGGYGSTLPEHLHSMVLPALTVSLSVVPLLINSLRASLTDALDSEYVAFGRSKGLRSSTVFLAYALRNGSISGISILGIQAGVLAGGTLVAENVFAIPGMGTLMLTGILNRDFPVVEAVTLVFAVFVVLIYLVTDVSYALVDPRARLT